jgi:hypothetical protein
MNKAESAEKRRVGEPGYPTANGRQEKNGTGVEEIASDDLDLQVGTAKPGTETVPNCGTETRQSAECAWRGPVPDPETGLVRCGCGGKAKLYHYDVEDAFRDGFPDDEWWSVYCDDCGIETGNEETESKAITAWNTAMGYRG